MDESDADQILTVEELRTLRDRMGAEAASARRAKSAARTKVPTPPPDVPLEARADPWEELPHRPRHRLRRRRRGARWPAAAGCVALAGAAVTVVIITAHTRSAPRSASGVSPPAVPAPPVSAPPVSAPVIPALPVPTSTAPEPVLLAPPPAVVAPVPIATAPRRPVENSTKRPAATAPAPRTTYRPAPPPPTSTVPADTRPSPTVVDLDGPPSGAASGQAGATSTAPEPP